MLWPWTWDAWVITGKSFCPCSWQGVTTLEILFPGLEYVEVDFEKERIATGMMEGVKNFVQSEKFRKHELFHSSEGRLKFEEPGISWKVCVWWNN